MIRGAVCRADFGDAQRGHEQRGRHYAVVISPGSMPWSAVTVVPTSTKAQPAVFRPEPEIMETKTRFLVDLRTIDVVDVHGGEHAVARYLSVMAVVACKWAADPAHQVVELTVIFTVSSVSCRRT